MRGGESTEELNALGIPRESAVLCMPCTERARTARCVTSAGTDPMISSLRPAGRRFAFTADTARQCVEARHKEQP